MANWASDNDAWGLNCSFTESGWSSRMSGSDLLVTPGESLSGTSECSLIDPYGAQSNQTKTWRFGQPASFSATAGTYRESVDITSTPTMLVENLAIELSGFQSGSIGAITSFNLGSTASTQAMSLSGMSPGDFHVKVKASNSGMMDWDLVLNLDLKKENTPPVITVTADEFDGTYATWSSDTYSFTLEGTVMDPDGGNVELSATMCDETTTSFTINGENWVVSLPTAKCVQQGLTMFDVVITATDEVGDFTPVQITVPDYYYQPETETTDDSETEAEEGLPSIGFIASMMVMISAALIMRRD